ncbi:MAG TPA: peroxiredoxin [Candidatus Limnocylindria bacterium]|nr:peroxiredoxin [Candidatus Limnocylindria bacterium]
MGQLERGDAAPAFTLTADDGTTVSTESMRGKRYVLYFYPKDDTPGCTTEASQFNENLSTFDRANVPVIGVSRDDAASHQTFRTKYGLRFPLVSDPDQSAHEAYGAWGERPGRGVGVIRSTFVVGPDGRIEHAWYGVTADGHAQEVLKAVGAA